MKKKKVNRYELVHKVAKLAKEKQQFDRNPIIDKKSNYMKTINEVKRKRNYVAEAYEEIVENEKKADEE